MAAPNSFRSAFNGFNREDVVHYIEYLNSKHTSLVNQLKSENQALTQERDALRAAMAQEVPNQPQQEEPAAPAEQESSDRAQWEARIAAVEAERDAALCELAELREQIQNQAAPASSQELRSEELEAYRRAERTERAARERAAQLYRQATGTLAEATTHIDTATNQFCQIAERINGQIQELQTAVADSKNALLDATATMYAIRPEDTEE